MYIDDLHVTHLTNALDCFAICGQITVVTVLQVVPPDNQISVEVIH